MLRKLSDVPAFQRDPLAFFESKGHGASSPFVPLRIGFNDVYLIADPAFIKPVFSAPEELINKGRINLKLRQIVGDSSITLLGEENRKRREVVHKNLHQGLSGSYVPQIAATIRQFITGLAVQGPFDAADASARLALRIICNIVFGKDVLTRGDENAIIEAVHLAEHDIAESMFRVLPPTPWAWWQSRQRLRQARGILSFVIEKTKPKAAESSLLRSLVGLGLSGEALRDEVMLMMIAGHHTSGAAGAWLLYHLATETGVTPLIGREARELSDDTGELTPARVKEAVTSRAYVHEILRLYPSSHWIAREVKEPTELGGIAMSRGTTLIACPWQLHRDPRYWPEPEMFRIDRTYPSRTFMPFGFGPRACIGASLALIELQLLALEVAAAFEVEVTDSAIRPRPISSVTLLAPPMQISLRLKASEAAQRAAA